jgi:hypothetical protein
MASKQSKKLTPGLVPHLAADAADQGPILRGKTVHFEISYLPALGQPGITIADELLAKCEADYATLNGWFANVAPSNLKFLVLLTDGKNGASHPSCGSPIISVGANSAPNSELAFMRCLLFAEVAEVLMHIQNHYWDCQASNGESLSRVLAADLCLGSLPQPAAFISAPTWLKDRTQNWIDSTTRTDLNEVANGCGVLFLNWMRFSLGYSWNRIIAAGNDTLAEVYRGLTGKPDAWTAFRSVIDGMFRPGQPVTLKTDNPFRNVSALGANAGPPLSMQVDTLVVATTSQALVESFKRVVTELNSQQAGPGGKPYLFPDGINDIEFEFKLNATDGVDVKIKVSGKS